MLQLLIGTDIPFMKYRRFAYVFSALCILATLAWFFTKGPRYSVDFTGGTLLQIRTSQVVPPDRLRAALEAEGIQAELQQMTGGNENEYLLRFHAVGDPVSSVQNAVAKHLSPVTMELRRNETVGPKVGSDLRQKAMLAILASLGAILLYVGIRYEFKFALGGVAALFHDVLVTLGALMFTGREVSLTVVAALLTIAGYSINDTIVVFDRVRENFRSMRVEPAEVLNRSINQTLSRTVITSFVAFLTVLALYLYGGGSLRGMAESQMMGIIIGTLSSIFVACPLLLWLGVSKQDLMPKSKDEAALARRP